MAEYSFPKRQISTFEPERTKDVLEVEQPVATPIGVAPDLGVENNAQTYKKTESGWGAVTPIGEVKITPQETGMLNSLEKLAKQVIVYESNNSGHKSE